MAFAINRKLVFIDSMQFMNSSLDALVKNLSEMDFNPETNIRIFIIAVYCIAYVFRNITKTFRIAAKTEYMAMQWRC